jgi:hypothetical protein
MVAEEVQGRASSVESRSIADCGLRIADCKTESEIRNPKSEISRFPLAPRRVPSGWLLAPRSGITLTEVLISLGILTIGLLGVAALFPVGSYYMQKGEIADRASAIAQAAFNDASARGVFNPAAWQMFNPQSPVGTYTKQFQQQLAQRIQLYATAGTAIATRNRLLNQEFGSVIVIDPLGTNGSTIDPVVNSQIYIAQTFPFNAGLSGYEWTNTNWVPWTPAASIPSAPLPANIPKWPLVRVTLPQLVGQPLSTDVARTIFSSSDDFAIDVPVKSSLPSVQRWEIATADLNNDGNSKNDPLARQSKGDYSWFATVVPTSSAARDALASDPTAFDYEVSVVVCYKRLIDDLTSTTAPLERLTQASIISTGLSGGQVLLTQTANDKIAAAGPLFPDPYAGLKSGQWIALCGPDPGSTDASPRFVLRWYRVTAVEKDVNGVITDSTKQRLVSLRGPQWPWQPAAKTDLYELSNNLCAAIVPGAVAVHSKTVRLEGNSAWSVQ